MENQDFFLEIAKTKHPIDSTDREILPLPENSHVLRRSGTYFLKPKKEESFEEQKQRFARELEAMRKKYRPFLANYCKEISGEAQTEELKDFRFRYMEEDECFTDRNHPGKEWENVTVPDYRGPEGRWSGYYQTTFSCPGEWKTEVSSGKRVVLWFQSVDYIGEVYVNGNFVGSHEGFFAPFSFDVTRYLKEENELTILCKNDVSILGKGEFLDGDKIYAATGPGWDDPEIGWHHCPAGAGLLGKVRLELRPELFIEDIFVRPDLENGTAELRIGVYNYRNDVAQDFSMEIAIVPENFEGRKIGEGTFPIKAVGPGKNEYRHFLKLSDYRLWEPETPWLYQAQVLLKKEDAVVSGRKQTCGMKRFVSDETSTPKGKFFLNGKPAMLRGANEMGHLQQCVMKEDWAQLVDDILIAKMCHMNYYRMTQRPVQEEIYDYFDHLGMMHQCDLPLFSFLRRPQFSEAVRQVGEMEHLVRRHVSTVMVTFINEPMCIRRTSDPNSKFSRRYDAKGHRNLLRDELEAFFAAARKAVYVENPDRVVKNVEGDYDGPTAEGMPDFHTYTMWYTNHGQPIGKLMRGYLPAIKSGWMAGCGEYGAEGLDPAALMKKAYPEEWLQTDEEGNWYPDKIVRAQTYGAHGDWYPEQKTMEDWVRESQIHQANATKLMTDAFRRRGDLIQQTAIHLLIDAWPSGWMKTLLDCERTPKRAYFAYQESLVPLKAHLYSPRKAGYEGETLDVQVWVLNDTGEEKHLTVHVEVLEEGGKVLDAFEEELTVSGAGVLCAGKIPVKLPGVHKDGQVTVQAAILKDGQILHQDAFQMDVYKKEQTSGVVYTIGEEAAWAAKSLGIATCAEDQAASWLVSGSDPKMTRQLKEFIERGGKAVWLLSEKEPEVYFGDTVIRQKNCGKLFFAAAEEGWADFDLSMLYQEQEGYIDSTAERTIQTDLPGEALVYTYSKSTKQGPKEHLPFVKSCRIGEGTLILCSLELEGRTGVNPELDRLLGKLLGF